MYVVHALGYNSIYAHEENHSFTHWVKIINKDIKVGVELIVNKKEIRRNRRV